MRLARYPNSALTPTASKFQLQPKNRRSLAEAEIEPVAKSSAKRSRRDPV